MSQIPMVNIEIKHGLNYQIFDATMLVIYFQDKLN